MHGINYGGVLPYSMTSPWCTGCSCVSLSTLLLLLLLLLLLPVTAAVL
jgi:hypothetical protein